MSLSRRRLGEVAEDYLKTIYKLQGLERPVTTSVLAARLHVADATVTAMVKRLAKLELLTYTPYRGVELTLAGETVALDIIRRHRLIELYLAETLGLSWDKVDAEAERLEHLVSDELAARIDAALGYPTTDPHGDPIPAKDGTMVDPHHDRLVEVEAEATVVVRRVSDHDPAMLRYVAELGLVPNTLVRVVSVAPFGGPMVVLVDDVEHAIGRELASAIWVSRDGLSRDDERIAS